MKSLARCHIWWPGIDKGIEEITRSCEGCLLMKRNPKLTPVHPWEFPEGPWQRVQIKFAGPFEGRMFLVAVDAYSKWPEVMIMERTTTTQTIDHLRNLFARWGIPQQVVSDNGPQFVSEEFTRFIKANNIKHTKSSPYHLATNGLAEHFIQTFKQALKTSRKGKRSLEHRMADFLIRYRNVVHATTETSPAQLDCSIRFWDYYNRGPFYGGYYPLFL